MGAKIQRVGIIANTDKINGGGRNVIREAARLVRAARRQLHLDAVTAELAGLRGDTHVEAEALARAVDLLLVFGGDGTMLRIAREIAGCRTPMLGINIGGLGFLTGITSSELGATLSQVWKGAYEFETRALVHSEGRCCGRQVEQTALNDIVISRGSASRLIELEVRVDGAPLTRYRCDGLIISSPTGSTAYSLAAGGTVIFPTADVLALTPICPHSLTNRALVLPGSAVIQVTVISPRPTTILSADGQVVSELDTGDCLRISRSKRGVRLLNLGTSFCETLRRKLHWRGGSL